MKAATDHTGQRFGRLTVLRRAEAPTPYTTYTGAWWLCRCDCGREIVTMHASLVAGKTTSCGCRQIERTIETNKARRKK